MFKGLVFEKLLDGMRFYSTKTNHRVDLKKLRPMIMRRIEQRANEYPVKEMQPIANQVLRARHVLHDGVSTLVQHIPTWTCKCCPEVYIGEAGHLIRTCPGYHHHAKNKVHNWVRGSLNDVLIPVETFHLRKMFQQVIKHQERFDYERIPAVVELCLQAGADAYEHILENKTVQTEPSLSDDELRLLASRTLRAWEILRSGVQKLMLVYSAKVCKHCSEVHVGPSGHKARTCGVFKFDQFRGNHFWEKAKLDDLVPCNIVWHRRRQDPQILVHEGRDYYGRAPAVVDLCSKAGALVPKKYFCMMKVDGLTAPV